MFPKTALLVAAFVLSGVATAFAQQAPSIQIDTAWARASSGQTSAAYLTLKNMGSADDRLVAASTPAAGRVELHNMFMEGDVMRMRAVPAIPVAAHGTAELKPGGLHIMLIGLKSPLRQGDKIELTLNFEKMGGVTVQVPVRTAGATNSENHHQ
jgi:copper(I)-binding protein